MTNCGNGAPPEMNQRTCDRSAVANSGASSNSFQIVGTPRTTVQRSCSIVFHTAATSKPLWITTVPPMQNTGIRNAASPPAWYIGVKTGVMSSSRSPQLMAVLYPFQ